MIRTKILLLTAVLSLIMSLFSVPCFGQTLVQHAYVDSLEHKKQVKLTFSNATTLGDLLVVMGGWDNQILGIVPEVSDNINGDYTLVMVSSALVTHGATSFVSYLPNCEGGTPTITVKLPTEQNNIQLNIVEIKGASSLDDSISQGTNNVNGTYLLVTNTGRTTSNDIILGCFSQNIPDAMTLTSGMPIDVTPGGNSRFASAYLIEPAGSLPVISGTVSRSVFFAGCCVAFKAN
jgi:hypothetical protein